MVGWPLPILDPRRTSLLRRGQSTVAAIATAEAEDPRSPPQPEVSSTTAVRTGASEVVWPLFSSSRCNLYARVSCRYRRLFVPAAVETTASDKTQRDSEGYGCETRKPSLQSSSRWQSSPSPQPFIKSGRVAGDFFAHKSSDLPSASVGSGRIATSLSSATTLLCRNGGVLRLGTASRVSAPLSARRASHTPELQRSANV